MRCPACQRDDLTEQDFGKNSSRKSGLQAYCRECSNKYQREWASQNADKCRESSRASEQKNIEHYRAYQREWWHNNPERQREDNLRLAALRQAAYVAPVYRQVVYEQCGWICQICGKPVDKMLRFPDPYCASLDHKVPISKGGTHEPGNAQLAHWICNVRIGSKS